MQARLFSILSVVLVLIFAALACTGQATPTQTPPPATNTPLPSPTNTPRPTATSRPTSTPDAVATQRYNDLFSQVQKFADDGIIPSTKGYYIELQDFKEEFSQLGWFQSYYPTTHVLEDFVFAGHLSWQTAIKTSDVSGCGIVFAAQKDNRNYAVFLDKSRIYFSSTVPPYYYELGKTRGSGHLSFGNPAEADLTLLVYNFYSYVYVNNNLIGEYTLSKDKPLRGYFGYGIISGTNHDYGTRCEVTNARVWSLNP